MKDKKNFLKILTKLKKQGKETNPRGLKIIECENFNYKLGKYIRFMNFDSRKLNINYIKKEFLWYLKGDKFDTSITEHASMWKKLINKDGSINSNYGQYIFSNKMFFSVINELKKDKDSRRASIMILKNSHYNKKTNDIPCTYSINFRIREDKLNMTVRMRSQDAIYGMGNDAPCFSFLHEMIFVYLKHYYKNLKYGYYYHSCDSFHVYERHFDMLNKIINNDNFTKINCPKILNIEEVIFLINCDYSVVPNKFKFTRWLLDNNCV